MEKKIKSAACEAHLKTLYADARAIRDGTHPEVQRVKAHLEVEGKRRRAGINRHYDRELVVAKLLLKEEEKTIKMECAAAIEEAEKKDQGRRKRARTGEASGGAVPATCPEVACRVTRRLTRTNPGVLAEEFRGNLFGLSPEPRRPGSRCRKGDKRGVCASDRRILKRKGWYKGASLVVVDLALEESLARGDVLRLRETIAEGGDM